MKIKAIMALILVISIASLAGCGVTIESKSTNNNGTASTGKLTQELEAIEREGVRLIKLQGALRSKAAREGRFGDTPQSIRLEAEANSLDPAIESATDLAWKIQGKIEGKE